MEAKSPYQERDDSEDGCCNFAVTNRIPVGVQKLLLTEARNHVMEQVAYLARRDDLCRKSSQNREREDGERNESEKREEGDHACHAHGVVAQEADGRGP